MVGGPCDFSVSLRSKSFFFLFLGDFYLTWGPVGIRAWTRTWTRAPGLDKNDSSLGVIWKSGGIF